MNNHIQSILAQREDRLEKERIIKCDNLENWFESDEKPFDEIDFDSMTAEDIEEFEKKEWRY